MKPATARPPRDTSGQAPCDMCTSPSRGRAHRIEPPLPHSERVETVGMTDEQYERAVTRWPR